MKKKPISIPLNLPRNHNSNKMHEFKNDIEKAHKIEEYINSRIIILDENEPIMFSFYDLSKELNISTDDLDRLLAHYAGGNASGVTF
jgi:hypothetical protein